MRNAALLCSLFFLLTKCNPKATQVKESPFSIIKPIEEKYSRLSITEIQPEGWLKEQIRQNLDGFVGRLDTLVPTLIMEDEIYGADRLSKNVKSKDVGALGEEGDWQIQFLWWNSETQSNWRDGYIRSAIVLQDQFHLKKLEAYINYILSTQDDDGYLGIYDKDLRYAFDNENGELWAKSSLLRGLLAWYEYSKDERVLAAVERAIQNVMKNYPMGGSYPFYSNQPNVGGTSHGLTITDVFESLFRITKNEDYRRYCLFLYQDFSEQILNEDAQYSKLVNDTLLLMGHSVHTYEHLRSLAAAYTASGNPKLNHAMDAFLKKIEMETTASGAGIGDEWIGGIKADATNRGYEYCALHELMDSYLSLYIKSGDKTFGDKAEHIFLNAAQGSRHPNESCIAYLKSDNSYSMTGGLNGGQSDKNQTRYSYSPVHQEAAVCCVPNAGRIAPYYVQNMWYKGDHSIVASLLGPSVVTTVLNGQSVRIDEQTNYPFENVIRFEVTTSDADFVLKIRKPAWVSKFSADADYKEEDGFIVINKKWSGTEIITLEFFPEIIVHQDINNENYFTYGAMVLARPIADVMERTKTFPLPGFYNLHYSPQEPVVIYKYAGDPIKKDAAKLEFETQMVNPATGRKDTIKLVPMGNTILRQVTFESVFVKD